MAWKILPGPEGAPLDTASATYETREEPDRVAEMLARRYPGSTWTVEDEERSGAKGDAPTSSLEHPSAHTLAEIHVTVLTSLSPSPGSADRQRVCLASWQRAGCSVVAFQARGEIDAATWPGVRIVEARASTAYPGTYVPIHTMTEWACESGHVPKADHILVLNADCELTIGAEELRRLASDTADGVCCLVRHDVDDRGRETRFSCGIDGVLFQVAHAGLVPTCDAMALGRCWWDWVVPLAAVSAGLPLYAPTGRVLRHIAHPQRWDRQSHAIGMAAAVKLLGWRKAPGDMWQAITRAMRAPGSLPAPPVLTENVPWSRAGRWCGRPRCWYRPECGACQAVAHELGWR